MKYLVVFVCLFASSYAVDKEFLSKFVEEIYRVSEVCIPESKATKADLASLIAHNPAESHEAKCLVFCYHKHFKVQNEDGSLNEEGSIKALEPLKDHDPEVYGKLLQVFKSCHSVPPKSDPCEFAGDLHTCAVTEGKKGRVVISVVNLMMVTLRPGFISLAPSGKHKFAAPSPPTSH